MKTKGNAIIFQKIDAVCTIIINRYEVCNTIDEQTAEELADICRQISLDETIRVVIVTGSGQKFFSAGANLNKYTNKKTELYSITTPIAVLRCPTIAAINGDALGLGLELALACDIRIAVRKARFALPHIVQGMIPWDGATQRLSRLIGITMATEMILTARTINASEALRIGLISKIVPAASLMPVARSIANTMAVQSPIALSFAKEAINKGMELTLEQGLRLEADLYFLLHSTEDRIEGIKAFLEKRHPKYKGK